MEPRLVIMCGAKRGTTVRLSGAEMTIGRDSTNGLCIGEESISRKHCAVLADEGKYRIADFNSRNGTFVNGIPIREKALQHGDTIRLGHSELLFLMEAEVEDEKELAPAADPECTMIMSGTQLRVGLGSSVPDIGTLVRDLNALLKLSRRINTINNVDLLQRELLEIHSTSFLPSAALSSLPPGGRRQFGGPSPRRAQGFCATGELEDCESRVVGRLKHNERARVSEKQEGNEQLVLCVPLTATKKTIGVIYLVASPNTAFKESHEQFVGTVAGIFAIAFENVMHMESLEDENSGLRKEIGVERPNRGKSSDGSGDEIHRTGGPTDRRC